MIQDVLKKRQQWQAEALVIGNTMVASERLVQTLFRVFDDRVSRMSLDVVQSGAYLQAQADARQLKNRAGGSRQPTADADKKDRKEERRKKASEGKAGGGAQVGCLHYESKTINRPFA